MKKTFTFACSLVNSSFIIIYRMNHIYLLTITVLTSLAVLLSCDDEEQVAPKSEVFSLQRLSDDYFPMPEGATDFLFPNGYLTDVKNRWPEGWLIPDGNKIAKTIASLIEYNQAIPKPAEVAFAMNMTLGEYDFICSRLKTARITSP